MPLMLSARASSQSQHDTKLCEKLEREVRDLTEINKNLQKEVSESKMQHAEEMESMKDDAAVQKALECELREKLKEERKKSTALEADKAAALSENLHRRKRVHMEKSIRELQIHQLDQKVLSLVRDRKQSQAEVVTLRTELFEVKQAALRSVTKRSD